MKVQIHAMVDPDLRASIEKEAENQNRSLSNFVAILLGKGWVSYIEQKGE